MNKNKSKKGFKMFESIDLKKLSIQELRILLRSIDNFVAANANQQTQNISHAVESNLGEFGDRICEEIQNQEN
tara:strand:+ start:49 stop:267 length:219 start_codon:yes stop_codon:yes gene_type:complete